MLKIYALWNLSNLTYIIFWEIYTIYSPHIPTLPRSILSVLPSCPPNFWIFLFFFLKSFLRLGVLPNYSWAWGLYWSVVGRPGVMPLKKADFLLSQLLWDADNSLASIGTFCQSPSTMLFFLHKFCEICRIHCGFTCQTALWYPENGVSLKSSTTSGFYKSFCLLFHEDPWALEQRVWYVCLS